MATRLRNPFASASSGHPVAQRMSVFRIGPLLLIAAFALTTGCTRSPSQQGDILAVDDFGDTLRLNRAPQRIVSLNPTTTELLFALHAGSKVVGRTRWDVFPDSARFVPDVGDGIRPNVEAVLGARPDLVLLYASTDNRTAASQLRAAGVPTLSLKVDLPAQFTRLTTILGAALRDSVTARTVVDSVTASLAAVRASTDSLAKPKVFWIAELEPLIAIGGGSFLSELVGIAGGANVYADISTPSAPIALEDVIRRNPDIIFGGKYAVDHIRSDPRWKSIAAVRNGRVIIGDSFIMGRPSVRMGEAAHELARLIHPGTFR